MNLPKPKGEKWTLDEFFAGRENQEECWELVGGFPVLKRPPVKVMLDGATAPTMMTGANRRHNKISGNLFKALSTRLGGSGCDVYTSDAAVRTSRDQIRYPDIVVDCGTPPDEGYVFENPKVIVEIPSDETNTFDLLAKVSEYWLIESLQSLILVDPETRRVQLHEREAGQALSIRIFDERDEAIDLPAIGVRLPLSEVFAGLPPAALQA